MAESEVSIPQMAGFHMAGPFQCVERLSVAYLRSTRPQASSTVVAPSPHQEETRRNYRMPNIVKLSEIISNVS